MDGDRFIHPMEQNGWQPARRQVSALRKEYEVWRGGSDSPVVAADHAGEIPLSLRHRTPALRARADRAGPDEGAPVRGTSPRALYARPRTRLLGKGKLDAAGRQNRHGVSPQKASGLS